MNKKHFHWLVALLCWLEKTMKRRRRNILGRCTFKVYTLAYSKKYHFSSTRTKKDTLTWFRTQKVRKKVKKLSPWWGRFLSTFARFFKKGRDEQTATDCPQFQLCFEWLESVQAPCISRSSVHCLFLRFPCGACLDYLRFRLVCSESGL